MGGGSACSRPILVDDMLVFGNIGKLRRRFLDGSQDLNTEQ
jgi:hypothetical protein